MYSPESSARGLVILQKNTKHLFHNFHSSVMYSVSREVNKVNQFQFNSSN